MNGKESYFHIFRGRAWPAPSQLERYFLTPSAQQWVRETRSDCWSLIAEGLEGTGQLPRNERVDLVLTMTPIPIRGCYCIIGNLVAVTRIAFSQNVT